MDAQQLPVSPTVMAQRPIVSPIARPPLTRDSFNGQAFGRGTNRLVKEARVLMVGAGGIGCELLKNLVLAGFGEIHVVDLDTIDLSNLNRQFLFRHEHIKKSKALVAKEVAHKFNPNTNIVTHHANIKESQFNIDWYKGFNLAFNALDNLEARRHVNRMCLAADVPLIDAGTTGFNGQVQVIKKSVTACYDCVEKPTPKSFPVCTIRSTPSQPIHCIVWGKSYLLSEIFGTSEDDAAFDNTEDQENAQEIEELRKEAQELRKIREAVGTEDFPKMLFTKVFNTDIARLRSMKDMWKSRNPPEPLDYDTLLKAAGDLPSSPQAILQDGQRVWSLEENLVVFNDSLGRLSKRMLQLKKSHDGSGPTPIIAFDKDDEDTLDFVASSANIRSTIFGIDRKSIFDIKQMAGNIIPAIATTNAIVAALCVLEAFKVLKGDYKQVKDIFLSAERLLSSGKPTAPNPDCPVCGVVYTTASVDFSRATLGDLVEGFLRARLGYGDKEISISNEVGILYDPDETDNLDKKLSELGIKEDSFLTVVDEDDDEPFVNVVISIREAKDPLGEKPVQGATDQQPDIPRRPKKARTSELNGHISASNGDQSAAAESALGKRRRDEGDDATPAKKAKTGSGPGADDDVVVIQDDGAIVLD